MNHPLISIIIPAYNAEKYIGKCIDSILEQDFQDFEILVVNDGSSDTTMDILNSYNEPRLFVFSKENGGVSSARNLAISKVKGEWIYFVDADDYVLPGALTTFTNELIKYPNNEIYIFGYEISYPSKSRKVKYKEINSSDILLLFHTLHETPRSTNAYLWHKFFKREIIINNSISFCQTLDFAEDGVFWFNYARYIRNYRFCETPIYVHVEEISTSLTKKQRPTETLLNTFIILKDSVTQLPVDMSWFLEDKFMAWLVQPWCLEYSFFSYLRVFTKNNFQSNRNAIFGLNFSDKNNRVIQMYQNNSYYSAKIYQWLYYKTLLFKVNQLKKIKTKLRK